MPINVPTYDDVSPATQQIFDTLKGKLGFLPNLYATIGHSETALGAYLTLSGSKSSLSARAREVINLVVSEVNACSYCLAAHTALGKMNDFTEAQILEIRAGGASFDAQLDALAKFAKAVAQKRGHADEAEVEAFLNAGWTKENMIDAILRIGEKTITNYMHAATKVPVDFPAAPPLAAKAA